jgi:hypothetical protein
MGLDDLAALQVLDISLLEETRSFSPRIASSDTLLIDPDVECFQGFASALMVNSDDVVAFQSAVLTSSRTKIISQDSFSSDESSNAWASEG